MTVSAISSNPTETRRLNMSTLTGTWPPILAAAATAAASALMGAHPNPAPGADTLAMAGTVASVSSTMLGFNLAAMAVLASISNTHLVKMMHKTGHYQDLLRTLLVGCLFFLACATCGFALLFGAPHHALLMIGTLALHVGALVSLLDIGRKFYLVLKNLNP